MITAVELDLRLIFPLFNGIHVHPISLLRIPVFETEFIASPSFYELKFIVLDFKFVSTTHHAMSYEIGLTQDVNSWLFLIFSSSSALDIPGRH